MPADTDKIQGSLFGKPMREADFVSLFMNPRIQAVDLAKPNLDRPSAELIDCSSAYPLIPPATILKKTDRQPPILQRIRLTRMLHMIKFC